MERSHLKPTLDKLRELRRISKDRLELARDSEAIAAGKAAFDRWAETSNRKRESLEIARSMLALAEKELDFQIDSLDALANLIRRADP